MRWQVYPRLQALYMQKVPVEMSDQVGPDPSPAVLVPGRRAAASAMLARLPRGGSRNFGPAFWRPNPTTRPRARTQPRAPGASATGSE